MPRCPVCESVRIVVVLSPDPRAFCAACGARWVQEGALQRNVVGPAEPAPSAEPSPESQPA